MNGKKIKKIILLIIIAIFQWSNVAWALAPATGLPAVSVDLIALDSIQDLAGEDIRIFYKEISGGRRGFGIRDTSGDNNKWTFYVVDLERGEFIRYLSSRDVNDRFFSILNTIEEQIPVGETVFKPNGREYIKQEFRITDRTRPFIKSCIDKLPAYPEVIVSTASGDSSVDVVLRTDKFPDGELRVVLEDPNRVKGKRVRLTGSPVTDDELVEFLFSAGLLKDCGAGSVDYNFSSDVPQWFKDIIYGVESREKRKYGGFDYILAGEGGKGLARVLAGQRGLRYGEWTREDGHITVPEDIRYKDCVVVHPIRNNRDLVELFMVLYEIARINPYRKITCIIPYFSYARQHKGYKVGKNGVSANSAGAILKVLDRLCDELVTMNVHFLDRGGTQYLPNAEGLPVCNLNAFRELAFWYKENVPDLNKPILVAPDRGAYTYVREAARKLGWSCDYLDKQRLSPTEVEMKLKRLDVKGRDVIILDDIIATGTTMIKAACMLKGQGANRVFLGGVHGQFSKGIDIFTGKVDGIICTETLPGEKNIVSLIPLLTKFMADPVEFAGDSTCSIRLRSVINEVLPPLDSQLDRLSKYTPVELAVVLGLLEISGIFKDRGVDRITVHSRDKENYIYFNEKDKELIMHIKEDIPPIEEIVRLIGEALSIRLDGVFERAVKKIQDAAFRNIDIVLPKRLDYMGDIIFVYNTAYHLKRLYPNKAIRAVFCDGFSDLCRMDPRIDPEKEVQVLDGIEFYNVKRWDSSRDSIALIYNVNTDVEFHSASMEDIAKNAPVRHTITELGVNYPYTEPKRIGRFGDFVLGFGKGLEYLGMPPTSPGLEELVDNIKELDTEGYRDYRKEFIYDMFGDRVDSDNIAGSDWGFIYAHGRGDDIERYFQVFETARRNNEGYGRKKISLFVVYTSPEFIKLCRDNGYNVFEYDADTGHGTYLNTTDSPVTIFTIKGAIPQSRFNRFLALSREVPLLITGQNTVADTIYLSAKLEGRPFFWERGIWQLTEGREFVDAMRGVLKDDEAGFIKNMYAQYNITNDVLAKVFYKNERWRRVFSRGCREILRKANFKQRIIRVVEEGWTDKFAGRDVEPEFLRFLAGVYSSQPPYKPISNDADTFLKGIVNGREAKKWVIKTIEDAFTKVNYMGNNTLFSLLLAQSAITPGWFKKAKEEDRWEEIFRYIAGSSFLDRWYLEKLQADGKLKLDNVVMHKLISIVEASRRTIDIEKSGDSGWLKREVPELEGKNHVYISPEAKLLGGLKSLMSGGLGVLAGELLVGLGDIGMNTHGVSLLYKKALVQEIDSEGNQIMHEVPVDYSVLPLRDTGLMLDVAIGDKIVKVKVWELREGRARVFLLDTDVKGNSDEDRKITEVLYGGSKESPGLRLRQYIVLGRGAVLACEKMNIPIDFLHLNEAHTVVAAYDLKKKGDPAKIIFTTHTPVEAGLPRFDLSLGGLIDTDPGRVWRYFHRGNQLDLTFAALKMADMANGVSHEHRDVTVRRWAQDYRDTLIGITNGVDVPYWQMPDLSEKRFAKRELLGEVKKRTGVELSEDVLTIVLSRRITGYKHATMILEDLDRLADIVNASGKPVQIIFAGNTHPRDTYGLEMIKRIVSVSKQDRFKGRIVFVPNYNVEFAKLAVRGADIWLTTPEPEEEACATSYAKALKNGTIVISTYTGGPIEHVVEGESGFFIKPYDVDTLYKCIIKARDLYYNHPDVWQGMMDNAVEASVEIRAVAREYVRKAFIVSLLKDRFKDEVEISNMQPVPKQEVVLLTEDDAPEITVQVRLGSLKPDYINVYIYFGPEGDPSSWRDIGMVLDGVIDSEKGIYQYKGRIPIRDLQAGRYGFTTRVSLMGLKEQAFCKWHSWAGNDGVLIVKDILSLYPEEIVWVREHARRVAKIAEIIASRMQLGDELVRLIRIAASAHDLGKGSSREMITAVNSNGPKIAEIIDRHREESLKMLEEAGISVDEIVRQAILYHHDPWLTTGRYARLATEIVYLADQIDASQDTHRPYKKDLVDIKLLQAEFRRHYKTGKISRAVYKAVLCLLTEDQHDFIDIIYQARGGVKWNDKRINGRLSSLFDSIIGYKLREQTLSLRWEREINAVDLEYFYRYVSGIEGMGEGERGHIIMSLLLAIINSSLDIKGYDAIKPFSDLILLDRLRSDAIRSHAREFRNSFDPNGEKSREIMDLLRRIKREVSEEVKPFVNDFIIRCRYLLRTANHPLQKGHVDQPGLLYQITIDGSGRIVDTSSVKESVLYNEGYLVDAIGSLVNEYGGPGIVSGIRKVKILDRSGHVEEQVDNEIEMDIDVFRNKDLVIEVLEHGALHEILGLIIPDKPDLAKVVATWYSAKRFSRLLPEEQRVIIDLLKDPLNGLDPNGKHIEFLEYIIANSLKGDDLIRPVVAYLNFRGIDVGEVKQVDRNFQDAIRLFSDLSEAERQRPRVIRRFDGVRVIGRVSDRVRKLVGYIARNDRLALPETPDVTRPRYIVVNKDREKSRLEDILRDRYDIHVVTEIPSDGEFVVLVNPEDVGRWKGQELLYLPLPYMEQSLKLAAGMLLSDDEIAHNYVKDFYNILLGRNLSDEETANLFLKPWWILPEISALAADLIILREAISQLEKSA